MDSIPCELHGWTDADSCLIRHMNKNMYVHHMLLLWSHLLTHPLWMASSKIKLWRLPVFKLSEIAASCTRLQSHHHFLLCTCLKNHILSGKHEHVVQTVKAALWMRLPSYRSKWTNCGRNMALVWTFTYKLSCQILWALWWHGKSRLETCHVYYLFDLGFGPQLWEFSSLKIYIKVSYCINAHVRTYCILTTWNVLIAVKTIRWLHVNTFHAFIPKAATSSAASSVVKCDSVLTQ